MKLMKKLMTVLLVLIILLAAGVGCLNVSALKAGDEVKGNTVCQALGMDGGAYMNWLLSHEHDNYYLGTPYLAYDHRNPKGDCKGAYGYLDRKGVAGMNCMGFVWHVLYKATLASGGSIARVNKEAAGRLTFYRGLNISRRYFKNKQDMLKSGYLEKGDLIWMIPNQNEDAPTVYHHIGIYWGDGHSDVFWHSNRVTGGQGECNAISKIYPFKDWNNMYVVLKVGAVTLSKPKLTSAYNVESGIKLNWNKVDGAAKYRVFVKKAGHWKSVGDTKGTSFIYRNAAEGENCVFTVRCITAAGKGYSSFYDSCGIPCTRCSAPTVTFDNSAKGIKLSWNNVKNVASYRVYIMGDGGYKRLIETGTTNYTYSKAQGGKSYTFTVRSVMKDGTPGAYRVAGYTTTYIAPPKITSIEATDSGVRLNWTKPSGAGNNYRVFRRDNGKWTRLVDVAATTYTDTASVGEGTYSYAVRSISADGKRYLSAYGEIPTITVSRDTAA